MSASVDRNCDPAQAPFANYNQLSFGQSRELRKQRGYRKQDTKAALRTRLAAMDTKNKKTAGVSASDMGSSTSVWGKRNRTPIGEVVAGDAPTGYLGKRPRGDALKVAMAADLELAKGHAQRWSPEVKSEVDADRPSVAEGVDGSVAAWIADGCG